MLRIRALVIYGTFSLICLFILILYILGAANYLTAHEENTCEMTYMFEYPQYVKIAMEDSLEEQFPRFALYAYGEGFITEKIRRMKFSGIPVLFIPGNGGSHEQVRSLASISLRKSLNDRLPFHFDYFSVSLGKDYSALYGGVLMEETIYVSHCIRKVLSIYKGKVNNLILIGHSMGGIVAKSALLTTPNVNASHASILITLATPHTPSLVIDRTFAKYFEALELLMPQLKNSSVNVVSIGGGSRDILISSSQTIDRTANLNLISTSIPGVWKSTDHLCILWCKQLILTIVRALFDSVDITHRPPTIASDSHHKLRALSYHFIERYSGKHLRPYRKQVKFERGGVWIENIRKQYVWSGKNAMDEVTISSTVYLMIRVMDFVDQITIHTLNLENKDWLFGCSASRIEGQSRSCDSGWNLSNRSRILPDIMHRHRKIVDIRIEELKPHQFSHIVIQVPPSKERKYVKIQVDAHYGSSRILNFQHQSSLLLSTLMPKKSVILKTNRNETRYIVKLSKFIEVVNVKLNSLECLNKTQSIDAVIELIEPWNIGVSQLILMNGNDNKSKTLRMQTTPKCDYENRPELRLTLDATCSYNFIVQDAPIVEKIAVRVRDRWSILHPISIAILLLTIAVRFDNNRNYLLTAAITVILCIQLGIVLESCVSFMILHLLALSVCCSIIFLGSVAHNIAVRFLARAIAYSTTLSDWLLGGLSQLPVVTTIIILSIVPASCGALAMIILIFLQFLKLTRMYEDYLEELFLASLRHFNLIKSRQKDQIEPKDEKEANESTKQTIKNQLILFLLLNLTAVSAIPSVLAWAKNFSYNKRLTTEDPVLLYSWIFLISCVTMGLVHIPSKSQKILSRFISIVLRCIAWIILCTTTATNSSFYQWWSPPFVAISILLISIDRLNL